MKSRLIKVFASLVLVVLAVFLVVPNFSHISAAEGDTYQLVTDASSLAAGDKIVIANKDGNKAMGAQSGNYRDKVDVTISDNVLTYKDGVCVLTLGGSKDAWTLKAEDGYLHYISGTKNTLNAGEDKSNYTWKIEIKEGITTITSVDTTDRVLQYNTSSPRFACYTGTQQNVSIYKLVDNAGGGSGEGTGGGSEKPACTHSNTTDVPAVPATCTTPGTTAGVKCSDCAEVLSGCETVPALGHKYENGECTVCKEKEPKYSLVNLSDISASDTVVIVSTKDGKSYAMSNDNGTTGAPTAVDVTISGGTITDIKADVTTVFWNIVYNSGNLTIYPDGTTEEWLYCTNANNGVRVGTNDNKVFTLDASGYLKHTATKRYLGVYLDNPDWRCYTNTTGNTAGQTFSFYIYRNTCDHTNTTPIPEVAATCTNSGTSAATWCNDCKNIISGGEITASKGGHAWDENYVCTVCNAKGPDAVKDVPDYDDGTAVIVLGTVSNIDFAWNDKNGNMSVTITDGNGNDLYLYKLATKVELGDYICVTGTKTTFNGTKEIDAGATAEIIKPTVKGMSATLNKGVTINVKYDIPALWLNANPGAKAVFSNGVEVVEVALVAGENVWSVDLKPGEINDALTVKIQLADDTVYGEETDVSFTAYKAKIEATDAATLGITETKRDALVALIDAALQYSAAADKSLVENLGADFAGVADRDIKDDVTFLGYAGTLGEYATMKILVNTNTENVTGKTLTVKVGEKTVVDAQALADYVNADGHIVIDKLYPTHFNDVITIQVNGEDALVCTFNSYLKYIYGADTSDAALKNLAAATYLYGVAAEAFVSVN